MEVELQSAAQLLKNKSIIYPTSKIRCWWASKTHVMTSERYSAFELFEPMQHDGVKGKPFEWT